MVRLVRACGSKHVTYFQEPIVTRGQARKSLWIETQIMKLAEIRRWGQARKSLWIETEALTKYLKDGEKVRLVRACGSKKQLLQNIRSSPWSGS